MYNEAIDNKLRSSTRILKLKVIDGEKPKSSTGLVDSRLFSGKNNLNAIMDSQTCLWALKYDEGILPQPLRQSFTSFAKLLEFTKLYLSSRNIEVAEVRD